MCAIPAGLDSGRSNPRSSLEIGTWAVQAYQSAAERREELKQHMAVACSQLLAAPEEHVRNLRALLALTVDDDAQVLAQPQPSHTATRTRTPSVIGSA